MRSNIRVLGPATVVIAAVVALAWASPMAAVVHLLADTAVNKTILVMGGTQHPLVNPAASGKYIFDGQDSYPFAETGLADPEGNAGVPAGYVAGAREEGRAPAPRQAPPPRRSGIARHAPWLRRPSCPQRDQKRRGAPRPDAPRLLMDLSTSRRRRPSCW